MTLPSLTDGTAASKWDRRFIEMARLVATWSKDPSTQTGAVIAGPDRRVISVGFNGFPAGMPDSAELYANREEKYARIIHCEVNALLFARVVPVRASLYTYPFMSCDRCAVQMIQAGLRRFVAPRPTSDQNTRWGQAFDRTRKYIAEVGGTLLEVDLW